MSCVPPWLKIPGTEVSFAQARRKGAQVSSFARTIQGGKPVYWLVSEVHQKQDPDRLPSTNDLKAAALEGAAQYISEVIKKKGGHN